MQEDVLFVAIELRLKPNVGWYASAYPEDDPDRITRPADGVFYSSRSEARDVCEAWARRRFPGAEIIFRTGPDIPSL